MSLFPSFLYSIEVKSVSRCYQEFNIILLFTRSTIQSCTSRTSCVKKYILRVFRFSITLFPPPMEVCFLFLSFSFLLFSLSLILLAYLRVFLFFPSHIACNLFLFFVFFTLLSLECVFSIRSRPLSGDLFFDQYPHITNNQQIRKRNARGIIYSKFNGIVQHVSNGNVFPLNDI